MDPLALILALGGVGLVFCLGVFAFFITRGHEKFRAEHSNVAEAVGVGDDFHDLSRGRVTTTQVLALVTFVITAAYLVLLQSFHKFYAEWWDIKVVVIGVIASIVVALIIVATEWFRDQDFRTPNWVYGITVAGIILSLVSGIFFAEPDWRYAYDGSNYRQEDTRGYVFVRSFHGYSSGGDGGGSVSTPACTGKSCGYAALAAILIIIVLAVIILSATVPHFWVVGVMVLLTILIMMLIQDLRATASQEYR